MARSALLSNLRSMTNHPWLQRGGQNKKGLANLWALMVIETFGICRSTAIFGTTISGFVEISRRH
jgi:hypothetical protein